MKERVERMEKVRYGIIGIGVMGSRHANRLFAGEDPNGVLAAVCDIDPARLTWAKEAFGIPTFLNYREMYASGLIDAVIIATPHYDHPKLAIEAFRADLHVLCEKPAGVYTKQVREMNEAAAQTDKKFTMMFLMRNTPVFSKLKDLIDGGELGVLKRIQWTVTTWYRPQAYHDSSTWRSRWATEGGGVLINQAPHNLDLWQWLFGMPETITAHMSFGRYFDIEVEDDVTAFMQYKNGVTGTFITSTGEAPGTNCLEIVGDMGKIVVTNSSKITFYRNRTSERIHNAAKTSKSVPEYWVFDVPTPGVDETHMSVIKNLSNAIINNAPLAIHGEDGMRSLQLSNAMHLSAWTGKTISLPVDEELYYSLLQERISNAKK